MKLLDAAQIRALDAQTIQREGILSVDLMERAATECCHWLVKHYSGRPFFIFCGIGNNGGDGLAIARILKLQNEQVEVYLIGNTENSSHDFGVNLQRLQHLREIQIHSADEDFPVFPPESIVIDAILGTGISRPPTTQYAAAIKKINTDAPAIISIDLPSGLFPDAPMLIDSPCIKADHTLSFQMPKRAFLFSENAIYTGNIEILNIGLNKDVHESLESNWILSDQKELSSILIPRNKFDHKGSYHHCFIFAGSKGKMGAAVLATLASLRAGAGLTTAVIPACGYNILQATVPEAMCINDESEDFLSNPTIPELDNAVIALGPGLGEHPKTSAWLMNLISTCKNPLVLDADALNMLAANKNFIPKLPVKSILTPHPKEFDRLFGIHHNSLERLNKLIEVSQKHQLIIILKGAYSRVAMPDGKVYFNNSGNPGMATAGSGDVLTGIICGLLAQHYTPENAALLGVYVHGLAGDITAGESGKNSLIARDIIAHLGKAFTSLEGAL